MYAPRKHCKFSRHFVCTKVYKNVLAQCSIFCRFLANKKYLTIHGIRYVYFLPSFLSVSFFMNLSSDVHLFVCCWGFSLTEMISSFNLFLSFNHCWLLPLLALLFVRKYEQNCSSTNQLVCSVNLKVQHLHVKKRLTNFESKLLSL